MRYNFDLIFVWSALGILLCAVIFIYGYIVFPESFNGVYFLSVGQADASIISSDGAILAVDTGRDGSAIRAFERVLPWRGKRIDVIALSHLDRDHVGGLFRLLEAYRVGAVVWSGDSGDMSDEIKMAVALAEVPLVSLHSGSVLLWGKDSRIDVLWPTKEYLSGSHNDNDASLILRYQNKNKKVLFTGDVTHTIDSRLMGDFSADILKVSHHGSAYASSWSFLEQVTPALAVISVGKNSYGHPASSTLDRLAAVGSRFLRTDVNGTIGVLFGEDALTVSFLH